jgi:hypothetical protein
MKKLLVIALLWGSVIPCFAQLTLQQKISDFTDLAAYYDKNYGPYQWKIQVFNFDLLKLQPWLDQVYSSKDDLAFYDICVRYVASLHDFHDEFTLPSIYEAYLPLTADIYDGKVLVDAVDTSVLDPASFPISIGDELLSVDGISATTWVTLLAPYSVNGEGNPVSRDRLAIATMLDRYQGWYTYASNVQPGQVAKLVIKTAKGPVTYSIPWAVIGLPLFSEGPVPNAGVLSSVANPKKPNLSIRDKSRVASNAWGISTHYQSSAQTKTSAAPADLKKSLTAFGHLHPKHVLAGGLDPFDSMFPLFNPPPGFQLRLGLNPTDNFVTGTFPVGKATVGFIRIPSFEPADETAALNQFASEIAYFQTNTSGLVIDVMSNGGGDICYTQQILQYLIPTTFQNLGYSLRATENWLEYFEESFYDAAEEGAPPSVLNAYIQDIQQVEQALATPRGNTPPLPLCSAVLASSPATDQNGNNLAYTNPILVLTNNFTASAAELFGATLQDASRAKTYGTRTSGGGGNVVAFNSAPYAEGSNRVTESIGVRNHNISTPGYPSAPYVENIGVYPDLQANYQTKANLLTGGVPFVAGFSAAIANLICAPH